MSVDSLLDSAFTTLLGKARQDVEAERAVRPGGMDFGWGGGGQPVVLAQTDPMLLEVPFDARIVWAHLYAVDGAGQPAVITATLEIRLTQFAGGGGSSVLYGTGTVPALTAQSRADLDLTGWQRNLVIGDTLMARLTALSGTANLIVLTLQLRPTEVPIGVSTVVDAAGVTYVDAAGNPYVFRS